MIIDPMIEKKCPCQKHLVITEKNWAMLEKFSCQFSVAFGHKTKWWKKIGHKSSH